MRGHVYKLWRKASRMGELDDTRKREARGTGLEHGEGTLLVRSGVNGDKLDRKYRWSHW